MLYSLEADNSYMDDYRQSKNPIILALLGLEVLTAMVMKRPVSCDTTPFSSLKVNRRFGRHIAPIFIIEG
jgi:hypothetical protein